MNRELLEKPFVPEPDAPKGGELESPGWASRDYEKKRDQPDS